MTNETLKDQPRIVTLTASDCHAGERLDRFISALLEHYTRSRVKELIKSGCVTRSKKKILEPNARVKPDDCYVVSLPAAEPAIPLAENIPLTILYEDDDLIVIDKPAGLVVHPATGHWQGTLVNALLYHCGESLSGVGGVKRPGIVHRLDKETSGIMVVAKNDAAHLGLSNQFADHGREGKLRRSYSALVWGVPFPQASEIKTEIGRSRKNPLKMAVLKSGGKIAITHYKTVSRFGIANNAHSRQISQGLAQADAIASLVNCDLETGRTHQIRVHLTHIGHPLISDPLYGTGFKTKADGLPAEIKAAINALNRQALHASRLAFEHPLSGEFLDFSSALPADMANLEKLLKSL